MWFAWEMDGLIVHTKEDLKDTVAYKTKAEAIWDISCRYEDGRKRPKVNRIEEGCYVYYPKSCDGKSGNETTIVSDKYLKSNEPYMTEFHRYAECLLESIEEELEAFEQDTERMEQSKKYYDGIVEFKLGIEKVMSKLHIHGYN